MKISIKSTTLFLIAGLVFCSCKKEKTTQIQIIDPRPAAMAGIDQTITLPRDSVDLDGRGIDYNGGILKYEWKKKSGPAQFKFVDASVAAARVKDLVEGVYVFELKVTNSGLLSDSDDVVVTVLPVPAVIVAEDYRTRKSGGWNDASNWERFDGTQWVAASRAPFGDDGQINIRTGDTVTINSAVTANQIVIDAGGGLTIESDFTLTDDIGVDLMNNGMLTWRAGQIDLIGFYSTVELINNGNFLIIGNNNFGSDYWDGTARLTNNGTMTKTSNGVTGLDYVHEFVNTPTGIIKGVGTFSMVNSMPRSFFNDGIITPGLPIGLLAINNRDPFSSTSLLSIEVLDNSGPGSGHDELVCNNSITLNGTLAVTEIGGTVSKGRFTILTTNGTIQGNFSKTILPPGYSLQVYPSSVDLVKQ